MVNNYLSDIPKKLVDDVVHARYIFVDKRLLRLVVLTKTLKFLELKNQEIFLAFDLSNTYFRDYLGGSMFIRTADEMETSEDDSNRKDNLKEYAGMVVNKSISFGKFISYEKNRKRLFVLLTVQDKLVVLERTSETYQFILEYKNVQKIQIVDPEISYHAHVAIYIQGLSEPIRTKFYNNTTVATEGPSTSTSSQKQDNPLIQTILDGIELARSELAVHKIATIKQFISLKNLLTFGPNPLRSNKIEEKQPLSKYGDVWKKVNNGKLLIGIPIMNNCSRRLTTLQNIRPVLVCPEKEGIELEYQFYRLKDDSYTFNKCHEFFEEEYQNSQLIPFDKEWCPVKEHFLPPETSGVVVVCTNLSSFAECASYNYQCFILYDVFAKNKKFPLQNFIKNITITPSVLYEKEFQILMEPKEIYKNLLAVCATSTFFSLQIRYNNKKSQTALSDFIEQLGFQCIEKGEEVYKLDKDNESSDSESNFMDIDQAVNQHTLINYFFYHKQSSHSFWDGTLIRLVESSEKVDYMKIYLRSCDYIFAVVQLLYKELNEDCTIIPVSSTSDHMAKNVRQFKEALNKELQLLIQFGHKHGKHQQLKRSDIYEFQKELFAKELETDLSYLNLQHS